MLIKSKSKLERQLLHYSIRYKQFYELKCYKFLKNNFIQIVDKKKIKWYEKMKNLVNKFTIFSEIN